MRMTTSPPRWIIPKIGGFSVARVPRPRFPLKRLRRPRRPLLPLPPASPCVHRQFRPHHTPPRRLTSARVSYVQCLGVTDSSSAARRPYGDRVRGQFGGLRG